MKESRYDCRVHISSLYVLTVALALLVFSSSIILRMTYDASLICALLFLLAGVVLVYAIYLTYEKVRLCISNTVVQKQKTRIPKKLDKGLRRRQAAASAAAAGSFGTIWIPGVPVLLRFFAAAICVSAIILLIFWSTWTYQQYRTITNKEEE